MSKKQLAHRLGRSQRWVEMRVREGMPVIEATDRYGRRLYDVEAVEVWLRRGRPRGGRDRLAVLERRVEALEQLLGPGGTA